MWRGGEKVQLMEGVGPVYIFDRSQEEQVWGKGGDDEFSFRQVWFKVPMECPNGDV